MTACSRACWFRLGVWVVGDQYAPMGAGGALLFGYFAEYIDKAMGRVCCAFCRS